jgi:hypothetical protein
LCGHPNAILVLVRLNCGVLGLILFCHGVQNQNSSKSSGGAVILDPKEIVKLEAALQKEQV